MFSVCRSTIYELQDELRKIDPAKEMEVGQYRLDAKGNAVIKKVCLIIICSYFYLIKN